MQKYFMLFLPLLVLISSCKEKNRYDLKEQISIAQTGSFDLPVGKVIVKDDFIQWVSDDTKIEIIEILAPDDDFDKWTVRKYLQYPMSNPQKQDGQDEIVEQGEEILSELRGQGIIQGSS